MTRGIMDISVVYKSIFSDLQLMSVINNNNVQFRLFLYELIY